MNFDTLLEMPVNSLKNIAKDMGFTGYSNLTKKGLVDFLISNTHPKSLQPYINEWVNDNNIMGAALEKKLKEFEDEDLMEEAFENMNIGESSNRYKSNKIPNLEFLSLSNKSKNIGASRKTPAISDKKMALLLADLNFSEPAPKAQMKFRTKKGIRKMSQ